MDMDKIESEYKIHELSAEEYPQWNQIVARSSDGTIYHDTRWLQLISDITGTKIAIFGIYHMGALVGGIPLCIKRKGPISIARRAFATPYCNSIVDLDDNEKQYFLRCYLLKILIKLFWKIEITENPFNSSHGKFEIKNQKIRQTYVVSLNDLDNLWRKFSQHLRKQIRRIEREELIIEDHCHPDDFYYLYKITFERQGMCIPLSRLDCEKLINTVNEEGIGVTYCIRLPNGVPCAFQLVLYDQKRCYMTLAGMDRNATKLRTATYLYWHTFKKFAKTHSEIDLVGANIDGIAEFKSKFLGEIIEYKQYNFHKNIAAKIFLGLMRK